MTYSTTSLVGDPAITITGSDCCPRPFTAPNVAADTTVTVTLTVKVTVTVVSAATSRRVTALR